ncbi:GSCOCG00001291001-RA-CDS [Cotesia congregata]|uniref:Cell cycle checkpoint control protein n=1 Tax=Cotesia congregata TaxID=51543 RepID=A0A8J2MM76_COTCN|nr:GSCOCG00001291001-RA-CDS [Cotesia congregata]CAG5097289.1 Similar to Rad9a: Cell cycle checkpoint control protein RAD9A (Mus musculus) [Cotesia congregata]
MKCVIPGTNVKILARAIHALGKIGEELYVLPQERSLSFRTVSMTNSAYCDFTFNDQYFSYYNFGNLEEDDASKCKVSMRAAMSAFKTPNLMDKLVETCHIKLQANATKLIIVLNYKNSVRKTFLLAILNCENLQASYNKDNVPNHLIVQPKILSDAVQNFQQNLTEITLDVSSDKILLRNYVNDTSNLSNLTRTQLALAVGEFDTYTIGQDACVTFCMKEVRPIMSIAELVERPLHLLFEVAGRPVVFILKDISFEANLVLSTINPDLGNSGLSDASIHNRRQAVKKRGALQRGTKSSKTKEKPAKKSKVSSVAGSSMIQSVNTDNSPMTKGKKVPTIAEKAVKSPRTSNDSDRTVPVSDGSGRRRSSLIAETLSEQSTPSGRTLSGASSASIFTPAGKRRTSGNDGNYFDDQPMEQDDIVPSSPPPRSSKKARMIFKKCLQATFDPTSLPGHDLVLAKDSDEESD